VQETRILRFDAGQYSSDCLRCCNIVPDLLSINTATARPAYALTMKSDTRTLERLLAQAELCEKLASQSWNELEVANLRQLAKECREAACAGTNASASERASRASSSARYTSRSSGAVWPNRSVENAA
jgi:hypothetical protein